MAGNNALILVVEDDATQCEVLRFNLIAAGYDVALAQSGDEGLRLVDELAPDVILLDWMLPSLSGVEICRQIKRNIGTRDIAVIMMSARAEEGDRLRGLEVGADDYVVKPYSVQELMARVKLQLRRVRPSAAGVVLHFKDISLDPRCHQVWRGEQEVKLGPKEYKLLAIFMERPSQVFSRDQLLNLVWGRDEMLDSRTVDVHIGRLRKALMREGGEDPLRTVRGFGYALG